MFSKNQKIKNLKNAEKGLTHISVAFILSRNPPMTLEMRFFAVFSCCFTASPVPHTPARRARRRKRRERRRPKRQRRSSGRLGRSRRRTGRGMRKSSCRAGDEVEYTNRDDDEEEDGLPFVFPPSMQCRTLSGAEYSKKNQKKRRTTSTMPAT